MRHTSTRTGVFFFLPVSTDLAKFSVVPGWRRLPLQEEEENRAVAVPCPYRVLVSAIKLDFYLASFQLLCSTSWGFFLPSQSLCCCGLSLDEGLENRVDSSVCFCSYVKCGWWCFNTPVNMYSYSLWISFKPKKGISFLKSFILNSIILGP